MRLLKNLLTCFILTVVITFLLTTTAFAGIFDSVKSWVSGEVIAVILSAIVVFVAGMFGVLYKKVVATSKEAGEFLVALGTALEDKKITREEIGHVVKEGKDIFAVWR